MGQARLRIIFMGTPEFAAVSLRALSQTQHQIIAVYTQPPRPRGRGHKVQNSAVHEFALSQSLPVFHPARLRDLSAQQEFAAHQADIAIVAAYGLLLPLPVLDAPRYGCINVHASLLPRWRGASPIQHAILAGDSHSGITLMQMDEGLDTGGIIAQQSVPILPQHTASMLHDELADLGAAMVVQHMNNLSHNHVITPVAQDSSLSTYAPLLQKSDGMIDWTRTGFEIDCQIRALNPWPGTWGILQGRRFKILQVEPIKLSPLNRSEPDIVWCGEDTAVRILRLQPEGKSSMSMADAINGGYLKAFTS